MTDTPKKSVFSSKTAYGLLLLFAGFILNQVLGFDIDLTSLEDGATLGEVLITLGAILAAWGIRVGDKVIVWPRKGNVN